MARIETRWWMAATTWLVVLLWCAAVLGPRRAVAAEPPAGGVPPLPLAEEGRLALDLEDAIVLALSRNLTIEMSRQAMARAEAARFVPRGIFDPALNLSFQKDDSQTPATTSLAGADVQTSKNEVYSVGLSQLFPWGTRLSLGLSAARRETNSLFFFLNPSWSTDATATLTQPLLRGAGPEVTRYAIVVADLARKQSARDFEVQLTATLQSLENAYWDVVAAREAVRVKETSLALAEELLEQTQQRVRVGVAAKIDLVQSQAGVAARREELIAARNRAAAAEDRLKQVLGFRDPAEWSLVLETTEPLPVAPSVPALDESLALAFESRPELVKQAFVNETLDLTEARARNDLLPRLDLQASYGYAGIGGDLTVRDPDTGEVVAVVPGGFSDAAQQVQDQEFPHWTVGVTLAVPLFNRQARATLAQRRFERAQGATQLAALRQQVVLEVRQAVRQLEDGRAAIEAAVASRRLAERNLEAENIKFNSGLSTNFQVLAVQEQLATAQLRELTARLSFRKGLTALYAATGQLLRQRRVEIAEVGRIEPLRLPWK